MGFSHMGLVHWKNKGLIFFPLVALCLSVSSTFSQGHSLEPIFMKISTLQSHTNPKTGKL